METFYSILIDLGVLTFLGLLYYLWQRRRIIVYSTQEITGELQDFLYHFHSYLQEHQNEEYYTELNAFALSIEESLQTQELALIQRSLNNAPSSLPEEFQKIINQIHKLF